MKSRHFALDFAYAMRTDKWKKLNSVFYWVQNETKKKTMKPLASVLILEKCSSMHKLHSTNLIENFCHRWKRSHKNKHTLMNVLIGSPHKTYWLKQRPDYSYELCVLKSTAATAATIKWIYVFVVCAIFRSFSIARVSLFHSFQCTRIHTTQFEQTHVFSLHIISEMNHILIEHYVFRSVPFDCFFLSQSVLACVFCALFITIIKIVSTVVRPNVYDVLWVKWSLLEFDFN